MIKEKTSPIRAERKKFYKDVRRTFAQIHKNRKNVWDKIHCITFEESGVVKVLFESGVRWEMSRNEFKRFTNKKE